MQIFDEGKSTDFHGTVTDFTNTVFVLTTDQDTSAVTPQRSLSSGMLSRVDDVVVFNRLSDEDMCIICKIQVEKLCSFFQTKGINLKVSDRHAIISLRLTRHM